MSHSTDEPATLEEALSELEDLLRRLEDGATTLEESLACYERSVGLLKICFRQLKDAEQRISLLAGTDDEGRPLLQPFEHVASAEIDRPKRPAKGPGPGVY